MNNPGVAVWRRCVVRSGSVLGNAGATVQEGPYSLKSLRLLSWPVVHSDGGRVHAEEL